MKRFPRLHWPRARRALLGLGLGLVAGLIVIQTWYLGWVIYYLEHRPETTSFMTLRRAEGTSIEHRWVAYEAISPWVKRAVVAGEDAHFVRHSGFDWTALWKALRENLAADRIVRGGSTISQQLAKNLFLSPRQSLLRKAQEACITAMLEAVMSKRRILELYLNVIEWGDGVFGIAAASEHYYERPPARIGRWQAALLAARIPRPRHYDRVGQTAFLLDRASDIYAWSPKSRIPEPR